jgi:hypothetical protein
MDNVQNCDSYINIPSSQTYRSYLSMELIYTSKLVLKQIILSSGIQLHVIWWKSTDVSEEHVPSIFWPKSKQEMSFKQAENIALCGLLGFSPVRGYRCF